MKLNRKLLIVAVVLVVAWLLLRNAGRLNVTQLYGMGAPPIGSVPGAGNGQ